ncbi:aldo/keto reductase [Caldibacillus thermolactis]|uniref:Aldo/keto reductase n=1 Tax=Pallidibacillus thermolactis TaxID=251051 RepID=A0ABT2WIC0_9BACI|nr:aldo/keto reductase [Pallidibacillus thermolactis]MCU9595435.1 aldo/keto reductase [Pallidibacillus thermolactis]
MEKRRLGKSNLYVSTLGLGCMSLGTDEKKATEIVHKALEFGVNYFDTADLYDYGVNEKIVGQALQPVRDKVIIATKAGNRWEDGQTGWVWDASKSYIKEAAKKSLKRLGTDYIDLFQLHGGTMEDRIEEVIEAFEELKDEGYIRYYGISSIRPTVIQEYAKRSNIVSVMMQYSILDRRPEEEVNPLLQHRGIHIVARGVLAKGLLSDALLSKASNAVKENGYLHYSYNELKEILSTLKKKLARDRTMTAVSLQYVLANPVVASCVTGASSIEQLKENVAAVQSQPLTSEELQFIKDLTKSDGYTQHRIHP